MKLIVSKFRKGERVKFQMSPGLHKHGEIVSATRTTSGWVYRVHPEGMAEGITWSMNEESLTNSYS